jgi:hypothetical protein
MNVRTHATQLLAVVHLPQHLAHQKAISYQGAYKTGQDSTGQT